MSWWRQTVVRHGVLVMASLLGLAVTSAAQPAGLHVSASVDKTQVAVGEQLTLTITVSGDLNDVTLDPHGVPSSFAVVAQSRSQNTRFLQGTLERSVSLVYVLVPREPGTFALGPFRLQQGRHALLTEPLEVHVVRTNLPPPSSEPVERLTI